MALISLPILGPILVSESLIAVATLCAVYLLLRLLRTEIPQGLRRPPGPTPLPLIGNVLELGGNPHLSLTKMSQRYGDIMQIQIGTRPVVVLSGNETVQQALIKQGDDFAGRPDLHSFQYISNGKSLTFSRDHAGVWRARRKLAQNALRSFSTVESPTSSYSCMLEEHISLEAEYLVKQLSRVTEADGSFDPFRHIVVSVANVICAMCFGRRYSHDDQELVNLVNLTDEFGRVIASGNPADFIPALRILPNRNMRAFIAINNRFNTFVQKIVTDHYRSFDKSNIRDITDSLIEHCQDKKVDENANMQISDEKIVSIVNDLFGAGFDTISTALSWCLIYLVSHPDVQNKIHQVLDEHVGRERSPRLSDKPSLPYVEAFILETFRHSSFFPFTIPHCTTKDTALNGFYIPKDTCVFVNQWQVNHDPSLWKDPSTFSPERFLNAESTGINTVESEKVMLFGLGKRRCIGEFIGRSEVFLFLAVLLQQLEFRSLPGQKLDLTPEYGLTMKHKRCQLSASLRYRHRADSEE
ncbi:cytochrome P450 1A1-like [Polyodon spathula]|uniref:cytochrome P450 1A1-like n=1 Tax=Polyodon spathula TaxID=7913 RepID=UPI001B7F067D|nr:cytochrome P450 1A1-like [Polyodon spathula]